jgi:hypothetical protein
MTATKLRLVLFGVIALLLLGLGTGAWYIQSILAENVKRTDHSKIDAEISTIELQQLKTLQKQLAGEQDIINRAKEIAASTEQYRYQDQVVTDISDYAARYGIRVNTFDFSGTQAKASSVAGAKKTAFKLSLKGPIPYITFLRFLQDVEKNLTKIQVTSLTLSPDKNPNNIANPNLGLEVYLKS